MKNILAVDLGTHCGIAYNCGTGWMNHTYTLATAEEIKAQAKERMNRRSDIRIDRLYTALTQLNKHYNFDIVVFEDVLFASSTYAVQLWASLRAALWLAFAFQPLVVIECVGVSTLKKFATGHGGATKEMMSAALQRKHPNQWSPKLDDNAIDAAWLWHWANAHLTRAPKSAIILT